MRPTWIALASLLAGATARADIRNPDIRNVEPVMAFAGMERHPDHVFLLHVMDKNYWGPNVDFESRVIPIPGPEPFAPGFRRTIGSVAVLAVPKAEFERLSAEQRSGLSTESPRVLSCKIDTPRTSVDVDAAEPEPSQYRVTIADGTLRVEPVQPDGRKSSAVRRQHGPGIAWGIALAAAMTWLGLVVGRRLVRGAP